jgi:hypothetical protein
MTAFPSASVRKPRLEKGILTSANHPSGVTFVLDVQNVSQLPLRVAPSSEMS